MQTCSANSQKINIAKIIIDVVKTQRCAEVELLDERGPTDLMWRQRHVLRLRPVRPAAPSGSHARVGVAAASTFAAEYWQNLEKNKF